MRLFDEIEEHDDMAHDYADKARNPKESHESERLAHDDQTGQRSRHPIRDCGEYEQWLHRIPKLHDQRDENQQYRDRHHDAEFFESFLLLVILAANLQEISRRQILLELFYL